MHDNSQVVLAKLPLKIEVFEGSLNPATSYDTANLNLTLACESLEKFC